MLPLHQRRIIAFVLGKAITDNFHCPTSPLILLRSKFAYATEDKAQPLYAGRLALEFPCSIYIAEIQVGGPRAGSDPLDQSHLAVYRVQLQTTFNFVGFSSFNAFPLLVLIWGVLTHNRNTDLQTLAFLVCDHSVRLSNSPAGSISFI